MISQCVLCSDSRPHNCDESQGEVKLACGCMLPVVAGAFSHEGDRKLKCICAGKTPCGVGSVNGHKVKVMRDTSSTTCVVKRSLVEAEQMTGNHADRWSREKISNSICEN